MELTDKKMHERIEKFNQMAMNVDFSQLSIGLYHGKMGLCVYFYELAGLTSEKKYRTVANKILVDTVNRITDNLEIDPSNGLTGICMAVNFLIDSGYIEGNPNHVLKSYDDKIIQSLLFNRMLDSNPDLDMIKEILGSLTYLTTRLQNTGLSNNQRHIMQGVIIEMINKIESLHIDKFTEPASFSVTTYFTPFYLQLLQRIYQLNFYNYKIEKIIDGLSPHILCMYPLNKANRLSLCSAMNEINAIAGSIAGWDRHIELLQQDLDNYQIVHEFRNKNITFNKGLCGFYYLLRKTDINQEYNGLFINKIANSDIWVHFLKNDNAYIQPFSLYSGAPGVILTYLHMFFRSNAVMFFDKAIGQYV
jgi:hypothetical protein